MLARSPIFANIQDQMTQELTKNNSPVTAVLLTVRDMNREHLSTTITRMDAGVEPPWMVSRRVVGGCSQFMSRIKVKQDLACYISHYG